MTACLRWRDRRHSWRHLHEGGFDRRRYDVDLVSEQAARSFVTQHHYSGTYPAARLRYGLFDGVEQVGAAVLSVPTQAKVLTNVFPDLVPYAECLELGRFVLVDRVPANAESWFLARCWELAARADLRGVVSFSDPIPRQTSDGRLVTPGHLGVIYQASNAVYTGRSEPRSLLLFPDGTVLSPRALQKLRAGERGREYVERRLRSFGAPARPPWESVETWIPAALTAVGIRRFRHPGNHRYAFKIGPERRRVVIAMPRLPYPKMHDAA